MPKQKKKPTTQDVRRLAQALQRPVQGDNKTGFEDLPYHADWGAGTNGRAWYLLNNNEDSIMFLGKNALDAIKNLQELLDREQKEMDMEPESETNIIAVTDPDTANEALLLLGEKQLKHQQIETELRERILTMQTQMENEVTFELSVLKEQIQSQYQNLSLWANTHREELTNGKKSTGLQNGTLVWRNSSKSLKLTDDETNVIAQLLHFGFKDCVRETLSLQKQVIKETWLKRVDTFEQIGLILEIGSENFCVKPVNSNMEIKERLA